MADLQPVNNDLFGRSTSFCERIFVVGDSIQLNAREPPYRRTCEKYGRSVQDCRMVLIAYSWH